MKTLTETPIISPSTHEFAEVIHRLEAGGSMLPDTPENLMQIIGIYKAYAVPMDFYWRDLLYIAERVFLNPLPMFKYFLPQEYLDLPNHYAGDTADLRIWRGEATAHPELLAFMKQGELKKNLPLWMHHFWHDRINMEFAESCMRAMLWHQNMGGLFNEYLDSEESDTCLIAMNNNEIGPYHTHMEIHPSTILSVVSGNIPMSNHNSSARNVFHAAQSKQAIGIYSTNFNKRFDNRSNSN
jgi:hypothetical protein